MFVQVHVSTFKMQKLQLFTSNLCEEDGLALLDLKDEYLYFLIQQDPRPFLSFWVSKTGLLILGVTLHVLYNI